MKRDLKALISRMTLEEKAGLCSGGDFWNTKAIERLGIPSMMMTDGPHGLRKQVGRADHLGLNGSVQAVCFPAACATAASFDTELMENLGRTLGNECQAENIGILLGPAVNIKRSPLCGRNFEYFSEAPCLTGSMAAAYIKGVQSQNVGTSVKHFAANNQEYNRMSCSSEVSERALREIYFPGFEKAVKDAQPKTVMCSYNKINGTYSSENKWLLTKVLRDEWGFKGYVVTDWSAVADRVQGILAGLDLEMPASGGVNDARIVAAVKDGSLDEKILDETVERLLEVLFSVADHRNPDAVFDRNADHRKAVDMAAQCAVLLENNGVLPLNKGTEAAYIGSFAETPRYQGGGSSHINPSTVTSALSSAERKNRSATYVPAFSAQKDELLPDGLQQAVEAARKAKAAVIFAGLPDCFESEGYDRTHMSLPDAQNQVIEAVAAVQPNTVVVLHNGSPVECPWADRAAAILEMYLGGQGVGEACDRILWGGQNPCGRLPETFPMRLQDTPSYLNFPGDGKKVRYAEDVFVGYRYYDARQIPVRWAFGHGLSYTDFSYSDLTVTPEQMQDDTVLNVTVKVRNTGNVSGREVVQLYVRDLNGTPQRPEKELRNFRKISLKPGEEKTVSMKLTARDLSYWHEELHDWYAPTGEYEILIGHASDDIRLRQTVHFETRKQLPLKVSMSTTIGELLKDARTAPVLQKLFSAGMGLLYNWLRVPCMVLSLGVMLFIEALPRVFFPGGAVISVENAILARQPWCFVVMGIMMVIFYILYNKTPFGHNIRAIGANQAVALSAGLNLDKIKFTNFMVSGLFLGVAAALYMSSQGKLQNVNALGSMSVMMDGVLGVFLGMLLSRWSDPSISVYRGVVIMKILSSGFVAVGLNATWKDVVTGLFMLVIMAVSANATLPATLKANKAFAAEADHERELASRKN